VTNEGSGGEKSNEQAVMNKPAKMRSSIACVRCRRSKVKCVNNGIDTTCRTCDTQGRECTYPPPASGVSLTPKRTEANGGMGPDGENDVKRVRKREPDSSRKHMKLGEDPLETPPITRTLWNSIHAVFQLHFSSDLPFLHAATFYERIGNTQEPRSPGTQTLYLGILSLTARYIPELVAYTGYPPLRSPRPGDPRPGEPLYASEFYARALEDRIDAATMATPSLDTIQALLMLAFYSWGMCRGTRSWMWVGIATR
jgi:ribosomal protein L37AE/L43A